MVSLRKESFSKSSSMVFLGLLTPPGPNQAVFDWAQAPICRVNKRLIRINKRLRNLNARAQLLIDEQFSFSVQAGGGCSFVSATKPMRRLFGVGLKFCDWGRDERCRFPCPAVQNCNTKSCEQLWVHDCIVVMFVYAARARVRWAKTPWCSVGKWGTGM